jgi:hypothetical protein
VGPGHNTQDTVDPSFSLLADKCPKRAENKSSEGSTTKEADQTPVDLD